MTKGTTPETEPDRRHGRDKVARSTTTPLIIRRSPPVPVHDEGGRLSDHCGYELVFGGRVVRIGGPLGSPTGQSLVFRLHEHGGQESASCIRFTPTKRVWEKEVAGLVAQILSAAECTRVLEVHAHGMYSFALEEPPVSDGATGAGGVRVGRTKEPRPAFDSIVSSRRGLYAILPLCAGGDLFDLMADRSAMRKLKASDVADIIRGLICSLGALRDKRVIHGDIKPENMCFRRRCAETGLPQPNTFALIDFGFATIVPQEHAGVVHFSGTYPYLAPEVFDNRRMGLGALCTSAIDMFGAGASLFLLCNEWLCAHHEQSSVPYPGQELYRVYVGNMNKYRPDDRENTYRVIKERMKTYDMVYPKNTEGRTVVAILLRVVSRMTSHDSRERPTPEEVGIFLDSIAATVAVPTVTTNVSENGSRKRPTGNFRYIGQPTKRVRCSSDNT